MTLILTRVSRSFVLQAADRLVTASPSCTKFDQNYNKSLIYCAKDGIVALGFTGIAIIDKLRTDEWIAQQFLPFDLRMDAESMWEVLPTYTYQRLERWHDVGSFLLTLANSINNLARSSFLSKWQRTWIENGFTVLAAGYMWKRRSMRRLDRARPFVATIDKPPGQKSCAWSINSFKKEALNHAEIVAIPGGAVIQKEIENIHRELSHSNTEISEQLMAEVIKNVSNRTRVVGTTVLSTLISPPKYGRVHIRIVPKNSLQLSPRLYASTPQEYMNTPWIIGSRVTMAPSTAYGRVVPGSPPGLVIPPYQFDFETPPARPGWPILAVGPHFRHPLPR